jgi:cobalamin biosynthesis Mg chelatase CobN
MLTFFRIFYTSWMCACIIWCALVVTAFWATITEKNRKKQKAASKLGTSSQGEQSTSGVQSTFKMSSNDTNTGTSSMTATAVVPRSAESGSSGSKSKSGKSRTGTNKIEEKSQKMIQKAVMRIAFYPVVPLVTALPLALALSVHSLTEVYQFGWFSSIMSNLQVFVISNL